MESLYLGLAAGFLAWQDPATARPYAEEGLGQRRATGRRAPLRSTSLPSPRPWPRRSRPAPRCSTKRLGCERARLRGSRRAQVVVFTAARLEAWPAALRAASRALHHQLRSGSIGAVNLRAFSTWSARGLAEHRPEAAAVIQGAVGALVRRLAPDPRDRLRRGTAGRGLVEFTTQARREATEILVARSATPASASFVLKVPRWTRRRRAPTPHPHRRVPRRRRL